ncbi:MAG TPA: pseudouridine synthase [Gammaproteobacteria bacterium]|nr:pseudouridine synthase [Gammaproteobacteria bacterium]
MKPENNEKSDKKDNSEKLQKVLARAGVASRRQAEEWIAAGRITINGQLAKIGDRVVSTDKISVDNFPMPQHALEEKDARVLIYHKPEGEICTRSDPQNRPTVFDHLPILRKGRWVMIGRLDFNTSGLLLFTTDGELANKFMHPSHEIEREYAVRVYGIVTDQMIKKLKKGVELEDGLAKFKDVQFQGGEGRNSWYHVVICEGKNREVRRLWESQDVMVSRLTRVRFGTVVLPPQLRAGKFVELEEHEVEELQKCFS